MSAEHSFQDIKPVGLNYLLKGRSNKLLGATTTSLINYSMAKFMEKRWGNYPKYPAMWDPTKSREDNEKRDKSQPAASLFLDVLDEEADGDDAVNNTGVESPVYLTSAYPEWYQPLINATFDDPTPDVSQPTDNEVDYNGPNMTDVTCETSDRSPAIEDCGYAFGPLRENPDDGALDGKENGTWWAGYVDSCALAIYCQEDWTADCNATLKDVADYASAIFEKCQNPGNNKVGGRVAFAMDNCKAQIEIITASGDPPEGVPP